MADPRHLNWLQIMRLGLVQAALGSVVVLTTSTLNRVMVVELALPALLPGVLVALHYFVQVARPRMGHGSDLGGRRTPWIIGGMAVLAVGGIGAALAVALMASDRDAGVALAFVSFTLIGLGVSACGTSLLVLLAKSCAPDQRAAAATTVWLMMIVGFAVTAGVAGALLDPYSPQRLVDVSAAVSCLAFVIAVLAVQGVERPASIGVAKVESHQAAPRAASFRVALAQVWADAEARRFTIFVFVSMLAYSAQDLILEPFAGAVFAYTPGQSTQLSGLQHGGVFVGMLLAALAGTRWRGRALGSLRGWTIGGCIVSALALGGLAVAGVVGPIWPFKATVLLLGAANGVFSIAAIGSMMRLASADAHSQGCEGVRMGLWGAAQAVAFGLGGLVGTGASDLARWLVGTPGPAYAMVFAFEALLFVGSAILAAGVGAPATARPSARSARRSAGLTGSSSSTAADAETFDVVVIGGGPAGATAATDLAAQGRSVLLLDRAGRVKPCGGAIPPRLIKDFAVPDSQLVARANAARMISPRDKRVDIPIEGGFVGMVDRDRFDEWLRVRAADSGAERRAGIFERLSRDADGVSVVHYRPRDSQVGVEPLRVRARAIVGADGARSAVAESAAVPGFDRLRCVFAYHEIIRAPAVPAPDYNGSRCDVYYRGLLSPDFYGWVFPHGETLSVGTGSADKGFSLRSAVGRLRSAAGLEHCETLRREGAPLPMKPLPCWDNGRDVVLAGDAAGVVAPASGEGIYYAMVGGRFAAEAVDQFLNTGDARSLRLARKRFMRAHGKVFWVLGIMQRFWYSSDRRRERFVSICADKDVQTLTFDAYMNKELVRKRPMAHVRIFVKDMAHLLGMARV